MVRTTRYGDPDPDGRGGARPGLQMDRGSHPRTAHTRGGGFAPAVLLALIYAVALPYRTVVESKIQHDIEDKVRTKAGGTSARW